MSRKIYLTLSIVLLVMAAVLLILSFMTTENKMNFVIAALVCTCIANALTIYRNVTKNRK